jgi:hypothetical protein
MRGDTLIFTVELWSADGHPPIRIQNNEFSVNMPGYDWNYTAKAFEVVNQEGVPIFQLIEKDSQHIAVYGIFPIPGKQVFFTNERETGFNWQVPSDFLLKPIFKYPAWKHPGKYADESN